MSMSERKTSFKRVAGKFSHSHPIEHANFEDQNINVSIPILSIHGNHDDPVGQRDNSQSVCEKLASCGLLNYFGLLTLENNKIDVEPIILIKGDIKLAIYGMGFLPDRKLKLLFEKGKVEFKKPPKDSFNILITHQNRAGVNQDRFIPDDYYPDYMHLIIRGHEHEAQAPTKIKGSKVNGIVYQPGSTVATSINFMESLSKKVGVMSVKFQSNCYDEDITKSKQLYKCDYNLIELKSVRPMYVKNIYRKDIIEKAKDYFKCEEDELNERMISSQSSELAKKAILDLVDTHVFKKDIGAILPIVRIRIEYKDRYEKFDGTDFILGRYPIIVANKDMVLFRKQRLESQNGNPTNNTFEEVSALENQFDEDDFEFINLSQAQHGTVDAMIEKYFDELKPEDRLKALSLSEYTQAVKSSMEDGNIIGKVLKLKTNALMKKFESNLISEDVAEEQFSFEADIKLWFTRELEKEKAISCNSKENFAGDETILAD